jgi:hypothetical protein
MSHTQLPHIFSYIVAIFIHNHFESLNIFFIYCLKSFHKDTEQCYHRPIISFRDQINYYYQRFTKVIVHQSRLLVSNFINKHLTTNFLTTGITFSDLKFLTNLEIARFHIEIVNDVFHCSGNEQFVTLRNLFSLVSKESSNNHFLHVFL